MYIDDHSILIKLHYDNNLCQYLFLLSVSEMCQIHVMIEQIHAIQRLFIMPPSSYSFSLIYSD